MAEEIMQTDFLIHYRKLRFNFSKIRISDFFYYKGKQYLLKNQELIIL